MKNIRNLIPKGILPSRKELMEMSRQIDADDKAYEERQDQYYRGSGKIRKVTESSWKKTVKLVGSAISGESNSKAKTTPEKIVEELNNNSLHIARMVGGSKSYYCEKHPQNMVIFNANIIDKKLGKVWYGDLDLTIDGVKLAEIAKKLNTTLYVLSEMDCRFESEKKPVKKLIQLSKWNTNQL
jgi:hypothetical protein